jgi:hypothetical protein
MNNKTIKIKTKQTKNLMLFDVSSLTDIFNRCKNVNYREISGSSNYNRNLYTACKPIIRELFY